MTRPRIRSLATLLAYAAIFLGLIACERASYTTWSCASPTATKTTMILRKAEMEFQGSNFNFCGSLGNQSYFDKRCIAQTDLSSIVFIPSTGILVSGDQEYQCAAL